jgi:predicted DNA-binding protein
VTTTTIRLSRELHQRLARRAKAEHMTLAGAIERALDVQDREEFWARASATMGSTGVQQREGAEAEQLAGTLKDGLDPGETWDDVW